MEQLLGIVGFEDKGSFVLGEQYEYLNIVSTTDGCYFAKKENRNVPLTDEDTWKQFSRLGVDGKNIELGINSTHLQWRLEGDTNWTDLIALSSLKGADGKELEVRTQNGYIQTRLTGESWSDLVDLEDLKGPQGERGLQGKPLVVLNNGHYGYWDEVLADYVDSGVEASATVDIENATVNFTEAAIREDLQAGENVPTLFGKIKKWFNDLGALAWKSRVDYQNDIDNLPSIPESQIQSNWNQTDISKSDFIQNKPVIPTKISDLTNNSGFTTDSSVSSKINAHNSDEVAHGDIRSRISEVESSHYNHTQSDERYVQKEAGKGLYPQADATKLAGVEEGAQRNIPSVDKSTIIEATDWVQQGDDSYNAIIYDADILEYSKVSVMPADADSFDMYVEAIVFSGTSSAGQLLLRAKNTPSGDMNINYTISI